MAGADHYRHSSGKGVKHKNLWTIPQLSMKPLQLPSFTLIGTMVIELREFNDKKKKKNNMDKMQKPFFL